MTQASDDFGLTPGAGSLAAPWFTDPSLAFATPQLARAAELWRAKRGTRTLPARADFSLADLKFTLGSLSFLDIVRDADRLRFRVRLQGCLLEEQTTPMTGRFIDEAVSPHFAQKWAAQWTPTIELRTPMRGVARAEFAERRWFVVEALYAPLANDGETPDILMVIVYYHAADGADVNSRAIAERLIDEINSRIGASS